MTNHTSRANKLIPTSLPSLSNPGSAKAPFSVVALLLVILVGALFRLEYITQPFVDKFSWRESSTAMMAQNFYRGHWNILYPEVDWGGPGPNYQGREFQTVTYIAASLYNIFGQHDWVSRCVPVSFGLWGIFALYQLIRRVWDDERALVGAGLMSVLPGAVFIDRSFLPDPAMAALAITSLWMLVEYCQTGRTHYLVLSAFVGCLGILTKLPGIIIGLPAIYAIYAILGRRTLERQNMVGLLAAAGSVLIIVSGYYLWARHLSLTYPPYHFAGAREFISFEKISYWIRANYFLPELAKQIFGWLWTWPFAILVFVGVPLFPVRGEKGEAGALTAPWFFHWFGVALVIQYFVEARHLIQDPNNMDLFNPFAAAIGGHAIVTISRLIGRGGLETPRIIAIIGTIVIVGLAGREQLRFRYNPTYASSYHIGLTLSRIAEPKDLMISFGLNPCAIYYSRLRGWLFPPTEVWHTPLGWDYGERDIRSLKSLWERGAKWLVISNSNDEYINADDFKIGQGKDLWAYIQSNFELYDENRDGMIFRLPAYPLRSTVSEGTHGLTNYPKI
jgi:4-amino-4-deoxy-L-arabinose transferase-like glycosyltransferase